MYGRAPRALTMPISGTADDIGPGTYWPNEDAMRRKAGKNFYLSSFDENRNFRANQKELAARKKGVVELCTDGQRC